MSIQNLIKTLATKEEYVNYEDFDSNLKALEQQEFSVNELHELLNYSSNQYGYWMSKWYFSPQLNPDNDAKLQTEGWEKLSRAFLSVLIENMPNAEAELQREYNLIAIQHSLKKRVDYNETRIIEKIFTYMLSKTAILLNSVGFSGIASSMYTKSLYPKGTVGRMV